MHRKQQLKKNLGLLEHKNQKSKYKKKLSKQQEQPHTQSSLYPTINLVVGNMQTSTKFKKCLPNNFMLQNFLRFNIHMLAL